MPGTGGVAGHLCAGPLPLPCASERLDDDPRDARLGRETKAPRRWPEPDVCLGTEASLSKLDAKEPACALRDMEQRRPRFARRSFAMNGALCESLGTGLVAAGMDEWE